MVYVILGGLRIFVDHCVPGRWRLPIHEIIDEWLYVGEDREEGVDKNGVEIWMNREEMMVKEKEMGEMVGDQGKENVAFYGEKGSEGVREKAMEKEDEMEMMENDELTKHVCTFACIDCTQTAMNIAILNE